ncbi:DUF5107 domain-containing protein [Paenibacillus sp.]|uniref:DUF5107 domain-containing protein n=1 Tax=Paenibacillus sp. TaxID=58172 RepID=UPI0028128432|nr:DUF5107 domain-containing protein [Paenibacillus sp.]
MTTEHGDRTAAYRDSITLPTYPVRSANINPIIREYRREKPYPYKLYDDLDDSPTSAAYEALAIENEYLKVMALPALGGKLYSAFDKRNGQEVFYRNNVVKPQLVGLTGAWTSGGVEFNFPTGHRPTAMEVIDTELRTNDDGSASIILGEIDKVSELRFSVELRLYPGKAYIEQTVRIHNPTPLPQRFFFWNTASYPETDELECRYPSKWKIDEGSRERTPWPMDGNVDVRWASQIRKFSSIFASLTDEDFFGVYDSLRKRGTVHVADHREVPGKKYWAWGRAGLGMRWQRLLTDEDGPYIEHQAGDVETQNEYRFLRPYQTNEWKEYWFQAVETGPFTYASKELVAATRFRRGAGDALHLDLTLSANEPMAGAAVAIVHDGTEVFRAEGDWTPANNVYAEAELHYRCLSEGALRLVVTVGGETVVDHLVNRSLSAMDHAEAPAAVPWKDVVATPAFRIAEAEQRNHFMEALRLYDELLRDNPAYVEAYVGKAVVQLKMLLPDDAETTLAEALRLTPFSQEIPYYFGLVRMLQGRKKEARTFLLRVNDTSALAAASNILLGKLAMQDGEYAKALQYLEKATKRPADADTADVLSAVCLRKLGRMERAGELLGSILSKDPLNHAAAVELDITSGTLRAKSLVRGDEFFALSLAAFYDQIGDREAQLAVLANYTDRRNPLVLYQLGWLHAEAGDLEEAERSFREAEEAPLNWVFPSLPSTLRALERAIEHSGGHAVRARYYRGLILNAKDRFGEAEAEWTRCVREGMDYSVVYLNLGTLLLRRGDAEGATAVLEDGLRRPPANQEIAVTLNSIYKREGRIDKRLALLGDTVDASRLSQLFARMTIGIWNDAGKYREAMQLLASYRFRSWENEYFPDLSLAKLYRTTRMGLAREAMREERWDDAVRELSQVSVYPDNTGLGVVWNQTFAEERFMIGVCLEKKGDFAGALRRYDEVAGEALDAASPEYEYYVKSMHRKVELEWLGFQ